MGTTMVRRDLVSTEKVPSLTKLAHVASLTLIDQISKINQFPDGVILGNLLKGIVIWTVRKDVIEPFKRVLTYVLYPLVNYLEFPEFKQRVLSLPKHLIDEIFNAAFYNTHSNVVSTKIVSFDKIVNKMRFYPAPLLSSLRGFQGENWKKNINIFLL